MINNMNMSLDDFKNLLAELFGQPLNQEAEVAARDFWQNVSPIAEGVSQGTIAINVDVLRLSLAFLNIKRIKFGKALPFLSFWLRCRSSFFHGRSLSASLLQA